MRLGTDEVCDKTVPTAQASPKPALARARHRTAFIARSKAPAKLYMPAKLRLLMTAIVKTMRCEDKSPRQARIPLQIYGAGINFAFKIKLQKRKLRCRLNPPQARTALKRHKILPRPKRLNRATSEPNFIAAQRQNFTKRRRLVTR